MKIQIRSTMKYTRIQRTAPSENAILFEVLQTNCTVFALFHSLCENICMPIFLSKSALDYTLWNVLSDLTNDWFNPLPSGSEISEFERFGFVTFLSDST